MRRLAWRLWQGAAASALRRYGQALAAPQQAQADVFAALLRSAAGTRFARAHGLDGPCTVAEYQQRVPVMTPADLDRWVELIRRGESQVLTNAAVERLVPTSGSTGPVKRIPMTAASRAEYGLAVNLWMGDTLRMVPAVRGGRAYIATSPALTFTDLDSAIPVGYAEDAAYLGVLERLLLQRLLAVPTHVAALRGAVWRDCVRQRLLAARDLRFLSLWHPSYLSALFTPDEMPLLKSKWPRLAVISTWSDGHCAAAARDLCAHFPAARHQRKGLWLTEGVVSVPWQGDTPLALLNGLLEFEDEHGRAWLAHELQDHGLYRPLLSNHAGLYRYRLGDVVQVCGFQHATPCVRWLGRADAVSDVCGEKLSEAQVEQACRLAGLPAEACLRAARDREPPCYVLHVHAPVSDLAPLETALRRNPHYDWARRLGQLGPLEQSGDPVPPRPEQGGHHLKSQRLIP